MPAKADKTVTRTQLLTSIEVKAVDAEQRIIEGHAATFGNLDLNGDVISPSAFQRTLAEKRPSDIAVFVGHQSSSLPIGVPLDIKVDPTGLYTRTRIFKTNAGDDLLQTARELAAAGQPLGMSIGFMTRDSEWKTQGGQSYRLLTDIELMEFSYAAKQVIASPPALVTSVKTQASTTTRTSEEDEEHEHFNPSIKAVWSAAYQNDLPDSAFAYISPGGTKDESGLTTPRSLRHYPHHDADGAVDEPHLVNAVARARGNPSTGSKALPHLMNHEKAMGIGEGAADGKKAAFDALGELSTTLADLSNETAEVAGDLEHAGALGLDGQKLGARMRAVMRAKLKTIRESLDELVSWAEHADELAATGDGDGQPEGKAQSALHLAQHATYIPWDAKAMDNAVMAELHGGIKNLKAAHDAIPHDDCPWGDSGESKQAEGALSGLHKGLKNIVAVHDELHSGHDMSTELGMDGGGKADDDNDNDNQSDADEGKAKGKKITGADKKTTVVIAADGTGPSYNTAFAEIDDLLAKYAPPVDVI